MEGPKATGSCIDKIALPAEHKGPLRVKVEPKKKQPIHFAQRACPSWLQPITHYVPPSRSPHLPSKSSSRRLVEAEAGIKPPLVDRSFERFLGLDRKDLRQP